MFKHLTPIFKSRGSAVELTILVISLLSSLLFPTIALIYILVFPSNKLIRLKKSNFLITLPIYLVISISIIFINSCFLDLFNLPVQLQSVVILSFVLSLILFFLPNRSSLATFNIKSEDKKYIYLIYIIFILALFSRVFSTIHALVPILHDPEAHAFWAKKIVTEKSIDYFYSPGLHILAAFLSSTFKSISIAKSIDLVTNFFSAFSILIWSVSVYILTKKARLSVWIGLFLLIIPIPQFLYFIAGKNSFVLAVSLIPAVFICAWNCATKKSLVSYALLTISLISVGIAHYPTFGITILATVTLLLMAQFSLGDFSKFQISRQFLKNLMVSMVVMVPIVVSILCVGFIYISTSSENPKVDVVSSHQEAKEYHVLSQTSPLPPAYTKTGKNNDSTIKISAIKSNLKNSPKSIIKEIIGYFQSLRGNVSLILLGVFIVGLYTLIVFQNKDRYIRTYICTTYSFLFSLLIVIFCLTVIPLSKLVIVKDTAFMLLPLSFSLSAALLFYTISQRKKLEFTIIIVLAVTASCLTFKSYRSESGKAYVNNFDMAAFSWINNNVSTSAKFIGMSAQDTRRQSIIFPIDGSLWIPVFTNNQIANPFQELGFSSVRSHQNYEYSRLLHQGNSIQVTEAIKYFKSNGYGYIYLDGKISDDFFRAQSLISNNKATIVYNNNDIKILRLK